MATYHVKAGTQVKVGRSVQTVQDHTTTVDHRFTEVELVAGSGNVPDDNPAVARWARRGYYVFRRGDWCLIVEQSHVDIEY